MNIIESTLIRLNSIRINIEEVIPQQKLAYNFIETCIEFLFPLIAKYNHGEHNQEILLLKTESLLKNLLIPVKDELNDSVKQVTNDFIAELPTIYKQLIKDATAIRNFDPAAKNLAEVIIAYPGFWAICVHRISHKLYNLEIPIIPRLISEYAHSKTGIDIHPGAKIGESFFIDHGTGVVIGETCVIKNNVKIYQGVTLGSLQVSKELANQKRHPTIEDNVIIYSNSTILGGDTIIGHDSIIGGNTWITSSIIPRSIVYHTHKVKIRSNINDNIIDFQI